jgi:hypothetical protein
LEVRGSKAVHEKTTIYPGLWPKKHRSLSKGRALIIRYTSDTPDWRLSGKDEITRGGLGTTGPSSVGLSVDSLRLRKVNARPTEISGPD